MLRLRSNATSPRASKRLASKRNNYEPSSPFKTPNNNTGEINLGAIIDDLEKEDKEFGMAMSKDDTLSVSLLACAEGFPQPPNPNPNTGLWMVNTQDYSTKQVAHVPNANGRGRQEFCCEWNEQYYSNANPPYIGQNPDGSCNLEECAFYEAWYGSAAFQNVEQFRGYAELWNGLEVVGDCVYITNSYFHEVWRACPSDTEDEMWGTEL